MPAMTPSSNDPVRTPEQLVQAAREGDQRALEALVQSVSNDVYRLALRMTGSVADAEDATQEILIKVITRLHGFRAESSLRTWVFRIATNHLFDRRKGRVEALDLTFDSFATDLMDGLNTDAPSDDAMLTHEVKLGCTLAMLTCLERGDRAAYVLGEVFDVPAGEAAGMLSISMDAFRQRLSRATRKVEAFTRSYCGLVNASAPCHCSRRVARAMQLGRVTREELVLSTHARVEAEPYVQAMEDLHDEARLMRSHPPYAVRRSILDKVLSSTLFGD